MATRFPGFLRPRHLGRAAALGLAVCAASAFAQKKTKVIGFYPDYSTGGITNAAAAQLSYTIYFSIKPPTDGNISDDYIINSINAQNMVDMVNQGQAKGMGVLLCVGGSAESANFPTMVNNATARKKFCSTIADFCVNNGLAGVDIDWEFPGSGGASSFATFAGDLRAAIAGKNLVMSTNVNGGDNSSYTAAAMQQFDWVQIMSYDNDWPPGTGLHSSLPTAEQQLQNYATKIGASYKNKLVLGVPFYGKGTGGDAKAYRDILAANPSLDPTADNSGGYNFNGTTTLAAKTGYVLDNGYGGVMIWNLVQDAPDGRLLASISGAVKTKGYTVEQKAPVISVLAQKLRTRYSVRPMGDGLVRMHAAPGDYRLTAFSADGRVTGSLLQTSATGDISMDLSKNAEGNRIIRIEGKDFSGAAVAPR